MVSALHCRGQVKEAAPQCRNTCRGKNKAAAWATAFLVASARLFNRWPLVLMPMLDKTLAIFSPDRHRQCTAADFSYHKVPIPGAADRLVSMVIAGGSRTPSSRISTVRKRLPDRGCRHKERGPKPRLSTPERKHISEPEQCSRQIPIFLHARSRRYRTIGGSISVAVPLLILH